MKLARSHYSPSLLLGGPQTGQSGYSLGDTMRSQILAGKILEPLGGQAVRGIIHALAGNASLVTRWGPTFLPMIEIKSVDTRAIRKIIIDKTFLRSSSWWI